jgi:hypothetical protein
MGIGKAVGTLSLYGISFGLGWIEIVKIEALQRPFDNWKVDDKLVIGPGS